MIPAAGELITKDLTRALRTPYVAAEYIKITYGVALAESAQEDEMIEVPSVGNRQPRVISRKTLASIIGPRVEDILEVVINELEQANCPPELLTSGVVITGGTSLLEGIVPLAEDMFALPVRIGVPNKIGGIAERLKNPRYAASVGLLEYVSENSFKNSLLYPSEGTPFKKFVHFLKTYF